MDDLTTYLKKELVRYIKHEMDRGHSAEKIKKALVNAGHHHNLVQEAIDHLKKNNWDVIRAVNDPSIHGKVQTELYYDVVNSLVRYIEYHLAAGKAIHEIESALVEYGHTQDDINAAMETVLSRHDRRPEEPQFEYIQYFIIGICTLAFIIGMFWLSASTKASIGRVFIGLLPTLFTLVCSIAFLQRVKVKSFIAIFPFAFVMVFVFAGAYGNFSVFEGMDIKSLAMVNLAMSLFYVGVLLAMAPSVEEDRDIAEIKENEKASGAA